MRSSVSIISKIRQSISENLPGRLRAIAHRLLPAVVGFLLARAGIIGGLYPFGAAFAASAPHGTAASAMTGILLCYILPGQMTGRLRYIATSLAVVGIKWALAEFRTVSRSPFFSPAAAFAGVLLTGMVVSSSTGASFSASLFLYCAEGMLAAAASFFITGTAQWLTAKGRVTPTRQQICSAVVSASILSIALCQITFWGFSPARAALMVCLLIAAKLWREAGGAVAGIALGTVMVLSGESFTIGGICAAAGLLCSLFSPLGAIVSGSVFAAVCSLGSFASGGIDIFWLTEVLIAAVSFALIPIRRLEERLPQPQAESPTLPRHSTSGRLIAAANGLSGVSQAVTQVSSRFDIMDAPPPEQIYRRATQKICRDCAISGHCWGSARCETTAQFDTLTGILRRDGSLTRMTSPDELKRKCARWGEMTEEINRLYADFSARERARRRVAQVRSVVAEQLGGVSELLCELAQETEPQSDPDLARLTKLALEESGYTAASVSCTRDAQGQLTVRAAITGRDRRALQRSDLVFAISDALGIELAPASFTGTQSSFTMETSQIPPLRVDFGAAQHCCDNERLCGDSYEALLDDNGGAVMLLSDGMGSGGRAAVDSTMTCSLLGQLIRAGFGVHRALRVVNSALLIKSDDESLSTADCLRMSLFTGEVSFCKAGAAQSFIIRDGQVSDVDIPSLPLGIMRELDCGSQNIQLGAGDVVVMVSDGAITEDIDWLRGELERFDGTDPRALAKSVVSLAHAQRGGHGDDDITALVLCCRENAA